MPGRGLRDSETRCSATSGALHGKHQNDPAATEPGPITRTMEVLEMSVHHWFDALARGVAQRRSWRETLRRVRGHLRFLWVEEGAPPAAAGQEAEEPP